MTCSREAHRVSDEDGKSGTDVHEPDDSGEGIADFEVTGEELVDQLPEPTEAPPELVETFVVVVVLVNVSLFVTTLGVMLVLIPRWFQIGGALTAIGLVSGGWAYYRYRRFQRSRDATD